MKFLRNALIVLFLFYFTACTNDNYIYKSNSQSELKIITLAPSVTEILVGLSLGENIIAADSYSQKIDGVNQNIQIFELGDPNVEELLLLNPDIVFLSGHLSTIGKFDELQNLGIEVLNIETAETIEQIYNSILFVGEKTSKLDEANAIVNELRQKIEQIEIEREKLGQAVEVYFEISQAPYIYSFGSNTFLNELLKLSGGKNIFEDLNGWIAPSEEAIINANPQIIFTNVNVDGNLYEIKNRAGWENIDAVKNNRVYYIDENFSSRPSQFFINALYQIQGYIREVLNEE